MCRNSERTVKTVMSQPTKLIVESLLFSSDNPLSPREIHACLPEVSLSEIRQALIDLISDYDSMERSFVLKEVAAGYQFRTRSSYSTYILRMFKTSPARLSRAALETLAIIAYKQPVLRQEIERLRGVDVGGILRTLLEKGLIRIMGRKNLPGKPLIYGTTKRFLEVFDLKDLDSLPKLKEMEEYGSLQQEGLETAPDESAEAQKAKEAAQSPEDSRQEGHGDIPDAVTENLE